MKFDRVVDLQHVICTFSRYLLCSNGIILTGERILDEKRIFHDDNRFYATHLLVFVYSFSNLVDRKVVQLLTDMQNVTP
jgi:hypothetical protein